MGMPHGAVIFALIVTLMIAAVILGRILYASVSGLDRKEMAVVRRAAGPSPFVGGGGGGGLVGLVLLALKLLVLALWCFAHIRHRAAVNKVVGFNPRKQNRAEGVIFSFYELRITRTELIKGYEENARRIRLQGLTATVTKNGKVDVTIEGPDTKFVYSMPYDVIAGLNIRRARQFAALLNYEASLLGAPPKKVQEKPPTTAAAHSAKLPVPQAPRRRQESREL
jgi:hypothetical protein